MAEVDARELLERFASVRSEAARFLMSYRFAIQEVETKISILRQEFTHIHHYSPIEHVTSRLKSPESIIAKVRRRGLAPDFDVLRAEIRDIAGVRVVCSFEADVFTIQQMLCSQADLELLELKDYISEPKASGYRSLHAIVTVPVFLSDETVRVPVELQFRTIAQDFWASLEHKIYYKYEREVPAALRQELREAADTAAELDAEMARLRDEVRGADPAPGDGPVVTDELVSTFVGFFLGERP